MRIWSWQHVSVIHCWVEPSLLLSSYNHNSKYVKFNSCAIFQKIAKLDNSKLGSTQQQKICWHWHVARIISSQKIYGLYGPKHHIVEIRGDVTEGRTNKRRRTSEDRATQSMEAGCWVSQFNLYLVIWEILEILGNSGLSRIVWEILDNSGILGNSGHSVHSGKIWANLGLP